MQPAAPLMVTLVLAPLAALSANATAQQKVSDYRQGGLEALIDARLPREPKVSRACRDVLQAARAADPRVTTAEAVGILREQKITPLPSESTIKREFSRVDERRKWAARKQRAQRKVVELTCAGGELLLAADTKGRARHAVARSHRPLLGSPGRNSGGWLSTVMTLAFRSTLPSFWWRYPRDRNETIVSSGSSGWGSVLTTSQSSIRAWLLPRSRGTTCCSFKM